MKPYIDNFTSFYSKRTTVVRSNLKTIKKRGGTRTCCNIYLIKGYDNEYVPQILVSTAQD